MPKLNVAILAGGRSSEHDISRLSAISVLESLDRDKYEPVAVLIERSGDWRLTSPARLALPTGRPHDGSSMTSDANDPVAGADTMPDGSSGGGRSTTHLRAEVRPATVTNPTTALRGIDVIFPVLHGPFGEDGTIQGLLETAGVPYVGNGVLASAVGMDKAIFKAILRDAGIPVAPGIVLHRARFDAAATMALVEADLSWPVFVKPARLGSSIGISRATCASELEAAIERAFQHDSKVLVEQAIVGIEVEWGVLGNAGPIVSMPGEVAIDSESGWYDFDTKYLDDRTHLHVPARISETATARVQELALSVFQAVDCAGLARVDCFVTPDDTVVVNELNTMPGCTPTSAYAKLFAASGHGFNEVVDRLIQLAMDRHREAQDLMH